MASIRPAIRYTNSLNSSTKSDPSSFAEFPSSGGTSRALTKKNDATQINFSSMVKKLVENKKAKNIDKGPKFVVAADFLVEDLKKNAKKGTGLSGLHKNLFKGSSGPSPGAKRGEESSKKALTEIKSNTRTLAMVLRSERELLSLNKEQGEQIAGLKILLQEKNTEKMNSSMDMQEQDFCQAEKLRKQCDKMVEKLNDLCLKQREEIKSLKSAILFPDVLNSQLQDLLQKQGSELRQAKQLIPSLQRQVTSLTGQLQCLAEDLAEVKVDKYSGRGFFDNHYSSPRTPSYDHEDAANSLFDQEYSSGDYTTPESPDDMFLKDLNPCLTPYAKSKSKEFHVYDSPDDAGLSKSIMQSSDKIVFNTCSTKLSKSSDCCQSYRAGKSIVRIARRSGDSKTTYGKQMHHKLL